MTMWSPNKANWDDEDNQDFVYKHRVSVDGDNYVEEVVVDKQGYEILQDDTIKCADCGKKLVDIIKVKEDDKIVKIIKAQCPCGGESFIYEVLGHSYMQAAEGLVIGDMPTELIDGNIHITVEVVQ